MPLRIYRVITEKPSHLCQVIGTGEEISFNFICSKAALGISIT